MGWGVLCITDGLPLSCANVEVIRLGNAVAMRWYIDASGQAAISDTRAAGQWVPAKRNSSTRWLPQHPVHSCGSLLVMRGMSLCITTRRAAAEQMLSLSCWRVLSIYTPVYKLTCFFCLVPSGQCAPAKVQEELLQACPQLHPSAKSQALLTSSGQIFREQADLERCACLAGVGGP